MFNIDFRNPKPIYEQLVDSIEKLVIKGVLEQDYQLPSVRQLAMELSINPNTIQRAYAILESKGITYTVKGKGNFINSNCGNVLNQRKKDIEIQVKELLQEARDIGVPENEISQWFCVERSNL